jgi:hypothetical protein
LVVFASRTERSNLVDGSTISWKNIVRPISLIIVLSVYTFLLIIFGYLISTFLLIFLMFLICDHKKWLMHIVSSAIIVNLTFLLFHKWLGVQLPSGILRISW